MEFDSTEVGSIATYSCIEGFILNGDETRTCQSDEQWSGNDPTCERKNIINSIFLCSYYFDFYTAVQCPLLSDPDNGQVTLESTVFLSVATYSCNEGFILNGDETRTCQSDEQWSGNDPTCERKNIINSIFLCSYYFDFYTAVQCPLLSDPDNGQVTLESTVFLSVATYSCNEGFILNGDETRTCQSDEQWSGNDPTCERKNIINSIFLCSYYFDFYTAVQCPLLSDPDNGQVTLESTVFLSVATYSCNEGFILNGDETRTCQSDEQWSGNDPTCERKNITNSILLCSYYFNFYIAVQCPLLSDPDNGQVTLESTVFLSVATYSCNEGFILNGDETRTCQSDEQWSGNDPTCERKSSNVMS